MTIRFTFSILFVLILVSCCRPGIEFEEADIELQATKPAPIGGLQFILLKDQRFMIDRFGMFNSDFYYGTVQKVGDSIILTYEDQTINFDSIPLPTYFIIDQHRLMTRLRGRENYFKIKQ